MPDRAGRQPERLSDGGPGCAVVPCLANGLCGEAMETVGKFGRQHRTGRLETKAGVLRELSSGSVERRPRGREEARREFGGERFIHASSIGACEGTTAVLGC